MANLITSNTVETIPSYEVAEMMDKKHYEVLKMIQGTSDRDGIIQVLNDVQMDVVDFFIESTYIDSKGEERVCYECTKMGCDMLANKMTGKKGIAFTAKYVKAFNDMQKAITQINQLAQQQQPLQIGPRYSYNNYWIKRELSSIKPTDIPDYVEGLLEFVKEYKPSDRLATYKITRAALEDIQTTLLELWQREMVQASLNKLNKLIELQKSYINGGIKSNMTRKINNLEQENQELKEQVEALTPPEREWITIDKHGFSENYMYSWSDTGQVTRSRAYNRWISTTPNIDIMWTVYDTLYTLNLSEDVAIEIGYICKDNFDVKNFDKATIDLIFNRIMGVDDHIVKKVTSYRIDTCDSFDDGKIIFTIYNL